MKDGITKNAAFGRLDKPSETKKLLELLISAKPNTN